MSPNLYLMVRKLVHPLEWIPSKEPAKRLAYCTTPLPGIYGIQNGKRYLVAIRQVTGRKDIEHIFNPRGTDTSHNNLERSAPCKHLERILANEQFDVESHPTRLPNCKGLSASDLGGYKYLRRPLKVEYNTILRRWMFSDEMEYRHVKIEVHEDHKIKPRTAHFFTTDDSDIFIFMGYVGKKGKTKIRKNHQGMDERFWCWAPEEVDKLRLMTKREEEEKREELASRKTEFLTEDGSDYFMRVVRYVRGIAPEGRGD